MIELRHMAKSQQDPPEEQPTAILAQDLKKNHMYQRLGLKSYEEAFNTQIVSGTNCSRFESAIFVKKAKEAFRIGEFSHGRVLQDRQMVFHAVSADAPSGVPIQRCRKLRVVLRHLNRKEDIVGSGHLLETEGVEERDGSKANSGDVRFAATIKNRVIEACRGRSENGRI